MKFSKMKFVETKFLGIRAKHLNRVIWSIYEKRISAKIYFNHARDDSEELDLGD